MVLRSNNAKPCARRSICSRRCCIGRFIEGKVEIMSDRYNPFDDIDIEIRGRNVRDDDTTCLLSCGCLVGFVIGVLSGFFM